MQVEQEKSRKFSSSQDHRRPVLPATDCGMLVTMVSSFSLGYMAKNACVLLYKLSLSSRKERSIS